LAFGIERGPHQGDAARLRWAVTPDFPPA
jgi:hypothetical protein